MFIDTAFGNTLTAWMAPLLPSQKAFYLYLLCAFVIAALWALSRILVGAKGDEHGLAIARMSGEA